MKTSLSILILLFIHSCTSKTDKSLLVPGKGIGDVTLGKTYEEIIDIMGKPDYKTPCEGDKVGYPISRKEKMDYRLAYDESGYSIFYLYFKNDSLKIISSSKRNKDSPKIHYNNKNIYMINRKEVLGLFGKDSIVEKDKYHKFYSYVKQGISIVEVNDSIAAVHIYYPQN